MRVTFSVAAKDDLMDIAVYIAQDNPARALTFVDELEEFAIAVRGNGVPEVDGEKATLSLAVMHAGIRSAQEGQRVEIAEILADPNA